MAEKRFGVQAGAKMLSEASLSRSQGLFPRIPSKISLSSFLKLHEPQSKNKSPVLGHAIPVLGVKLKRSSTYSGNISTWTYVQPHQ